MSAPAAPNNRQSLGGSLYVADLKPTVTESFLFDFFRRVGDISSVRVCRDSHTNVSLGYAYVNFINEKDAAKALETLNYEPIDGRPCRISWSQRDPSLRKSNVGNLFVKNINKDIDLVTFSSIFTNFGEVLSCKLVTDPATGESRGYGFVHFKNPAHAQRAIENLNDKFVNEKQIFVGHFIPKNQRPSSSTGQFTNIYLKQFNPALNQSRFAELAQAATADCGKITSPYLAVATHEVNGAPVSESRGFGFVNYETHEAASKALERFKDLDKVKELAPELLHPNPSFPLYSAVAVPKAVRMQSQQRSEGNLYIKNIADSLTEERLHEIFKPFVSEKGSITSVKIMLNEENKTSKGFGFVCFDNAADARAALTALNGKMVDEKPLYVAIHQPRNIRQQQLSLQYSQQQQYPMGIPPYPFAIGHGPRGYPQMRAFPPAARGNPRPPYRGIPIMNSPILSVPILREKLKDTPDDAKVQLLGDQIFHILMASPATAADEQLSRKITGMILGNVHNKPVEDTVKILLDLCEDQNKLWEEVQRFRVIAAPGKP